MILRTLGEVARKPISGKVSSRKAIRRTCTGVRSAVVLLRVIEGETSASGG